MGALSKSMSLTASVGWCTLVVALLEDCMKQWTKMMSKSLHRHVLPADVADEATAAALVLELDHCHAASGRVEQPHIGKEDILNPAADLATDGDSVRRDAGHVVHEDPTRRPVANVNVRHCPVDLDARLDGDAVIARPWRRETAVFSPRWCAKKGIQEE